MIAWSTLRQAGVLTAILKMETEEDHGLDPKVHAVRTNMAPDVLAALLEYLSGAGLVAVADGKVRLTPEGRGLLDYEDGVLQLIRAYQPVLDSTEHLLAKLKSFGPGGGAPPKKIEYFLESQARRYTTEVYPAVEKIVRDYEFTHLLDVTCATGDLLLYLAHAIKKVVGVGIHGDGFFVRRANNAITSADLEKRLIAVTASALEVCTDTQRTFDRIGISRQLWNELDCLIATMVFSDLADREGPGGEAAVSKALSALPKNFRNAHLLMIEPVASPRFEKNYYAAELALLLRLSRTLPWPVEKWRQVIAAGKMKITREVPLTTDGLTIFLLEPR
jgi:SAM-dependent methyltransferase